MARKKAKKDKEKNNPIHIQVGYSEARNSRKNLLSAEVYLLHLMKNLQKYKELRIRELKKRTLLYQKIKIIKTNLARLERNLPKLKLPSLLKEKNNISEEIKNTPSLIKEVQKNAIEDELQRIKNKLQELQSKA